LNVSKNKKALFNLERSLFIYELNRLLPDESVRSRDVSVRSELSAGKASRRSEQIPRSAAWSEDNQVSLSITIEIRRCGQVFRHAEM
jgi:hypothetical protein